MFGITQAEMKFFFRCYSSDRYEMYARSDVNSLPCYNQTIDLSDQTYEDNCCQFVLHYDGLVRDHYEMFLQIMKLSSMVGSNDKHLKLLKSKFENREGTFLIKINSFLGMAAKPFPLWFGDIISIKIYKFEGICCITFCRPFD